MTDQIIFLLVLMISFPHISTHSPTNNKIQKQCAIDMRIDPTRMTLNVSRHQSMTKPGYLLPPESVWDQNGKSYGCVCYNRPNCAFRYCPLTPASFSELGIDCESGYHIKEYHKLISANLTSEGLSVYSFDMPIRRVVMIAEMRYMKHRGYKKCKFMSGVTPLYEDTIKKGFRQRNNTHIHSLKEKISTMYNANLSYCNCSGDELIIYTPLCYRTEIISNTKITVQKSTSVFANVGLIISIPLLLITFIVYTVLPEMRNIHGLTLRGYVGCLLIAYTSSVVIRSQSSFPDIPCLCFAYMGYFSFLGSFFWLNVMCFDIWLTFGGFRSIHGSVRGLDSKKFFRYSIYAWGCSTLLTGICVIMDFVTGIPSNFIRPEFGVDSDCWFKTEDAKALYFYGPMGVTVLCNLFFFITTIIKIIRQKKETELHLEGADSKRHHDNKQWFSLYLKLFIIMGLNWTMWIITWRFKGLKYYIWYITESGNEYQGLIIFIIFICKKNMQQLIAKRFRQIPNCFRESTTSPRHSSTRNTCTTSIS